MIAFVPRFTAALLSYHDAIKSLLLANYSVNGGILLFLIVFCVIGLGFVLYRIYYTQPAQASFTNYRSETIKDALWKWQWVDNKIEKLWCFCPTCNNELSYESDHLLFQTTFTCHTCNKEIMKIEGSNVNYVLNFVKKEIRRNIQRNMSTEHKK